MIWRREGCLCIQRKGYDLIPSAPHGGVCLSLAIIIHHASSKRQKGAAAAPAAPSKEELLVFARHYPIHFSVRWRALTQ
jgi:hypothetical protein